jgi:hypothetical protein
LTLILRNLINLLLFCFLSTSAFASIGEIATMKGSGALERDKEVISGADGVGVESMDTAITANGKMQINFIDDTRVDITEHSRLVIDEFVYDPNSNTGVLGLKASLGGIRYASGQIAKNSRQNVKIRTPSATIAVRGTDFVMLVDEAGGSMITLLPSCNTDGMCYTGEIEVSTDAGFVIMNQAFQTTVTTSSAIPPTKPLTIDVEESLLNSLLILRKKDPYDEEVLKVRFKLREQYDFLGVDFLEFDELNSDALTESIEGIWATSLDETQFLLADLLYDMLDQLNATLRKLFEDELIRQNAVILRQEKNTYGFDPTTGIFLGKEGDNFIYRREDNAGNNFVELRLHQSYGYVINLKQGDFENYDFKIGVDLNNSIDIIQQQ